MTETKRVFGRALIDLPNYEIKCGEYGELPEDIAEAESRAGTFDPLASPPQEPADSTPAVAEEIAH